MDQQMSAGEHYEHGLVLKGVKMFYEAIQDFRKAALDPLYMGKAQLQIALCFRSVGRHEEAVMAFRQALTAPTFSLLEQRHILYRLGQTLEALGRYDESFEVYGWIRKEDPEFQDVDRRMKHLSSGGHGSAPQARSSWQALMEKVRKQGQGMKPHLNAISEQIEQRLSHWAEAMTSQRWFESLSQGVSGRAIQKLAQGRHENRSGQPDLWNRAREKRRCSRVPVSLHSHFSSTGRKVAGEGELRDLSPWGCRVKSSVGVPVGENLECCIFPDDAGNPFIVDRATVRWISPHEFGLAFTNIRPGVRRQIAQLCRIRTMER
ncbi:PilZ domain-containing protein [Petrachloros mirabilis]